jgi:hypothetical protein
MKKNSIDQEFTAWDDFKFNCLGLFCLSGPFLIAGLWGFSLVGLIESIGNLL